MIQLSPMQAATLMLGHLRAGALRIAGDVTGHEFHGNQWTHGGAHLSPKEEAVAKKYGDIGPYKVQPIIGDDPRPRSQAESMRREANVLYWDLKQMTPGRPSTISMQKKFDGLVEHIAKLEPKAPRHLASHHSPFHAIADIHEAKMAVSVLYAFVRGKESVNYPPDDSTPETVSEAVKIALLDVLPVTLFKALVAGGETGLTILEKAIAGFVMQFDPNNPRAAQWANDHAAELATSISETTREQVSDALVAFFEGDQTRASMEDEILASVGDESRAEMIARTESMMAVNEGQRQGWDQAVDEGLLPENSKRVWIATVDACPICDDLDGEEVGLDEEYPNDGGDGPPQHPNCRCTEGIVS